MSLSSVIVLIYFVLKILSLVLLCYISDCSIYLISMHVCAKPTHGNQACIPWLVKEEKLQLQQWPCQETQLAHNTESKWNYRLCS